MLSTMLASERDVREPPAAQTNIPYTGHVIGLMRSEFHYYVNLRYHLVSIQLLFVLLVEVPHYIQRAILLRMEILADIKPKNGEWVMPKKYHMNVAAVLIMEPDRNIVSFIANIFHEFWCLLEWCTLRCCHSVQSVSVC